jgi:hypothetical protein
MKMEPEDEAYAEWLADIILTYFAEQRRNGRIMINESEIWKLLGHELPEGSEDRTFMLDEFKDNVIPFPRPTLH